MRVKRNPKCEGRFCIVCGADATMIEESRKRELFLCNNHMASDLWRKLAKEKAENKEWTP